MQGMSFLSSNQNPDGGWGYAPQQSSLVEPTSAAILALSGTPSAAYSCQCAIDWLRSAQHPDGGWGFSSNDPESAWPTAWAVLALTRSGKATNISDLAIQWLLNVKTLQLSKDTIQAGQKILTIDLSLRGWPWLPGEAAWVEPTALALMALESSSGIDAAARRKDGLRFIQDRRCPGGGWNVGSPVMFSSALPGRVHPTAWVLLALSKMAPGNIRSEDIKLLRAEMHRDGGAQGLAWGLLALRTMREDDAPAEARLKALQAPNGGWSNDIYSTAVAVMALRGHL
jgi:hypothetical protein